MHKKSHPYQSTVPGSMDPQEEEDDSAQLAANTAEEEIARLKDIIAWLKYGPNALNAALAENNTTGTDVICTCYQCLAGKRFTQMDLELLNQAFGGGDDVSEIRPCVLKKCLMIQCARFGLDCLEYDVDRSSADEYRPFSLDCHIVIVNSFNEWGVKYGAKLNRIGFRTNPVMPGLMTLFDVLQLGDAEFFQDGPDRNYFDMADA